MPEDYMLKEAVEAVRLGHKVRARDILTRLLRADQSNPTYWLWMSSVVETSREQVYCLQTALRLDPHNDAARRGLILAGSLPGSQDALPRPLVHRKWQVTAQAEPPQGIRALWAIPAVRISVIAVMGLVVIGLILAGVFGLGNKKPARVAARPTRTPGPAATFTATPTYIASTRVVEQVTPTVFVAGPTPLWMLLEVTYTPTPVYVNTPHPISEDFRIAQRAFGRGDWATALRHFKNATSVDPSAADIHYLIGEAQRMMGDNSAALESYNTAMEINPGFAPAYLGRALASQSFDREADIGDDLGKAIDLDPSYGEARLARVAYAMQRGDLEAAQDDLEACELLVPTSPLLAYYQAELALQSGDQEAALEFARKAYDLDRTYLPAYRQLGEMALANGEFATAKETLEIYLQYAETDARGWMALGQAYMELSGPEQAYNDLVQPVLKKDVDAALEAFERAEALDDELPGVYLYRAVTYLAQAEGQKAVNDLVEARRLDTGSFTVNLGLGRALLMAGRLDEAIDQIDSSLNLAQDDAELAAVYYWHAVANELHDPAFTAISDWQALLALPDEAYPAEWRRTAEEQLVVLTPSPTATRTPKPSSTPRPTLTKRPSVTPTSTKRVTPTP